MRERTGLMVDKWPTTTTLTFAKQIDISQPEPEEKNRANKRAREKKKGMNGWRGNDLPVHKRARILFLDGGGWRPILIHQNVCCVERRSARLLSKWDLDRL